MFCAIITSIEFVSEPQKSKHEKKSQGGTGILIILCWIAINICHFKVLARLQA